MHRFAGNSWYWLFCQALVCFICQNFIRSNILSSNIISCHFIYNANGIFNILLLGTKQSIHIVSFPTRHTVRVHIVLKGTHRYNVSWEPEGRYCCTKSMAMAPFWFSVEHLCSAITPFWLSTDNIIILWYIIAQYESIKCIFIVFVSFYRHYRRPVRSSARSERHIFGSTPHPPSLSILE